MAFFKRELTPVERFESTLRSKHAARQKLADRLSLASRTANGLSTQGDMHCKPCKLAYLITP